VVAREPWLGFLGCYYDLWKCARLFEVSCIYLNVAGQTGLKFSGARTHRLVAVTADSEGSETSNIELNRQAAALNHLLGEIGLDSGEQTQWWNLVGQVELGGRTATQAWLAGDAQAVRTLVESWYATTRAVGQRALANDKLLAELRQELAQLDLEYGSSNTLHRTA
jgi:hypothetical protein